MSSPTSGSIRSPSAGKSVVVELASGDRPLGRFGHTTTELGQGKVALFGGAVGDAGKYQITCDLYLLEVPLLKWTFLRSENCPAARAAHAAVCVDSMLLVLYGGATGGGSLSSDELHLLDVRKLPDLSWMTVPITGPTPGKRYGHTMVYRKPNLIVFGGNNGVKCVNDVWFMDVESSPFVWVNVNVTPSVKQPSARVYHSAAICKEGLANGMMVVFGGRTADAKSLSDTWGLRQHRDGRWDWVEAPTKSGVSPGARFQHSALFVGSKMLIIGGRDREMAHIMATAIYDTEGCEWQQDTAIGRFRHSSWSFGNLIYAFGGFDHRTQAHPTADLQTFSLPASAAGEKGGEGQKRRTAGITTPPPVQSNSLLPVARPPDSQAWPTSFSSTPSVESPSPSPMRAAASRSADRVKLSSRVFTKIDSPMNSDFASSVQRISIDRLEEEGRKIRGYIPEQSWQPLDQGEASTADHIVAQLLKPNVHPSIIEMKHHSMCAFCLPWEEVSQLCITALKIISQEPMVLNIRAPVKVFGDLHGQYYDMMRLFGSYKCPVGEDFFADHEVKDADFIGDIDCIDYLFLGDYVDRGTNSLEVLCLLLALKVKYPRQIHLIRGNHEDRAINSVYGFKEECRRRLGEDPDHTDSCWQLFNNVFDYLPVAAIIEEKILCLHGGIGGSIHEIAHLSSLKRPLKVAQIPTNEIEQRVTDLLWSDPTDNDSMTGILTNDTRDPDGSGRILKFGPDRVTQFLQNNKLELMIRAHECVMDGFERFAGGRLITLFSATDYCGTHKNAGALLFIRRDLTVVPKVIYPHDRAQSFRSTWLTVESRSPTPPRSTRRVKDRDLGF